MQRSIVGAMAATAAAPYLTAFLMTILDLLFLEQAGSEGLWELVGFIPLGTMGLLLFGLPLLLVASLLGLTLLKL